MQLSSSRRVAVPRWLLLTAALQQECCRSIGGFVAGRLKGVRPEVLRDEDVLAISRERVGGLRGGIIWTRWAGWRLEGSRRMENIGFVLGTWERKRGGEWNEWVG